MDLDARRDQIPREGDKLSNVGNKRYDSYGFHVGLMKEPAQGVNTGEVDKLGDDENVFLPPLPRQDARE